MCDSGIIQEPGRSLDAGFKGPFLGHSFPPDISPSLSSCCGCSLVLRQRKNEDFLFSWRRPAFRPKDLKMDTYPVLFLHMLTNIRLLCKCVCVCVFPLWCLQEIFFFI